MPYQCAFGHTSYDPCCDACDSATSVEHTGWGGGEKESTETHKAALRGLTRDEWLEQEDRDD
jgi:hypothetical protein